MYFTSETKKYKCRLSYKEVQSDFLGKTTGNVHKILSHSKTFNTDDLKKKQIDSSLRRSNSVVSSISQDEVSVVELATEASLYPISNSSADVDPTCLVNNFTTEACPDSYAEIKLDQPLPNDWVTIEGTY